MKKFVAVAMVILLSCTLVSCTKLYCNGCGEVSFEEKHKREYFGRDIYLCDDCDEMLGDSYKIVEDFF